MNQKLVSFIVFIIVISTALTTLGLLHSPIELELSILDDVPSESPLRTTHTQQSLEMRKPSRPDLKSDKLDKVLLNWVTEKTASPEIIRHDNKISVLLTTVQDPHTDPLIDPISYVKVDAIYIVHMYVASRFHLKQLINNHNVLHIQADKMAQHPTPTMFEDDYQQIDDYQQNDNLIPPTSDHYTSRDILGVNTVYEDFNITGEDVVVNVMDSGVDFGHTSLRGTMALDEANQSLSFSSGIGVSITSLWNYRFYSDIDVPEIAQKFEPLHTDATGYLTFPTAFFDYFYYYDTETAYYRIVEDYWELPDQYYVGTIPGNETGYAFGISRCQDTIAPFLLADSNTDGLYDSLYVDYESSYYLSTGNYVAYSQIPFSFNNQVKHTNTNHQYLSKDIYSYVNPNERDFGSRDGYIDISIGALANTYDEFNITQRLGNADPIIHGIDASGECFAHMVDHDGHGTACAGDIAAQNVTYDLLRNDTLYSIQGMAPNAKILATSTLRTSTIIFSWLWSCGYEPNDQLEWMYTGQPKCNISSNSFGYSSAFTWQDNYAKGFDLMSFLVDMLSVPQFLHDDYPGVLFVTSAGNSGPGLGTSSSPASAMSAIAVGASTNFWYSQEYASLDDYSPNQGYDQIISWSSSGPSLIGYPKVDVVAVGAFEYTCSVTNPFDDGINGFQLFGGTSQASPITAGILALIYQTYAQTYAQPLRPDKAKILVKSSAVDLYYDVFRQGAGRVDANRAIRLLKGLSIQDQGQNRSIFEFNVTDSFRIGAERYEDAFQYWFSGRGNELFNTDNNSVIPTSAVHPGLLSNLSFADSAIYGGLIQSNSNKTVQVSIQGEDISSIDPISSRVTYSEIKSDMNLVDSEYYYLFNLFNQTALESVDYIQITVAAPISLSENNVRFGIRDITPKGEKVLNSASGTWYDAVTVFIKAKDINEHTVFEPYEDYPGATISVRAYKRVVDPSITITDLSSSNWNITLSNDGTKTGIYEGYLKVLGVNGSSGLIPYSYSAPLLVREYSATSSWSDTSTLPENEPYNGGIFPAVDWGWRYESGDWRSYDLILNKSNSPINTLGIEIGWESIDTVLDVFVIDYQGRLIGQSDVNYVGDGQFASVPNANLSCQRLLINISHYQNLPDNNALFTIVIHATSVGRDNIPFEPITVRATWISNLVDEFKEPTASFSSDYPVGRSGTLQTQDELSITTTDVSENPIKEFTNVNSPIQISTLKGITESLQYTLAAEDLKPYTSYIEPEYVIEIFLQAGETIEATLGWTEMNTDFDLLLVDYLYSSFRFSDDLFSSTGATGNNPETASFTAAETKMYYLLVEFFAGEPIAQPFDLNYTIIEDVVDTTNYSHQAEISTNLGDYGDFDGSYLLRVKQFGWNFEGTNPITQAVYLDTQAPVISLDTNLEGGTNAKYGFTVEWSAQENNDVGTFEQRDYKLIIVNEGNTQQQYEDTGHWNPETLYTYSVSSESLGEFHIQLTLTDSVGISAQTDLTIKIQEKSSTNQAVFSPSIIILLALYSITHLNKRTKSKKKNQ